MIKNDYIHAKRFNGQDILPCKSIFQLLIFLVYIICMMQILSRFLSHDYSQIMLFL